MKKNYELLSFDCYGTLIDWRKGVLETLMPLFDEYLLDIEADEVFRLFKIYDAEIINSGFMFYRNVLREIMKKFASSLSINLTGNDQDCLVNSLPNWPAFADSYEVLKNLKKDNKLALITNCDNDLIEKTINLLGIDFDYVITSANVRSYKPSGNNFFRALEKFDLPANKVLHIAQSIYHDIVPCNELGINNVWVNRYSEPTPDDELEKPGKEISSLRELLKFL